MMVMIQGLGGLNILFLVDDFIILVINGIIYSIFYKGSEIKMYCKYRGKIFIF